MEAIRKPLAPNPRENANILSVLTFWWTIKLFKKGYKKVLELQDLFKPLEVDRSDNLGDRLEARWLNQQNKQGAGGGKPSLIKAIFTTFWREYLLLGCITFFNDIFIRITQPILLGRLLFYFRKDSDMTREEALYCAGGIVILNGISVLTINQFVLGSFQNGMKVRIAVCSIIYRKALRLSRTALGDTAPGKVVNLLSNDVNRFDMVSIFLHSMWSAPMLSIIIGYFLWSEVGLPGLIGMIVIFVVTPLQSYTGKLSSRFRLQTALRTDERVRLMDEIISGVQVIKMYAWEKPFSKLITLARRMELKIVRKNSYVRALYMTFVLFTTRSALFCTMMAMALLGENISAARVFVVSAYFNILAQTMSQMFVRGIAEIAEALVAMKRLEKFLNYEEKLETAILSPKERLLREFDLNGGAVEEKQKLIESETQLPPNIAISIKNATAQWPNVKESDMSKKLHNKSHGKQTNNVIKDDSVEENVGPLTLNNINVEFRKGILIGVVGHVGAGKSSLLQAILRELPLENGSITVKGTVSYVSQEPWVFAGSVKQNILFGEDMVKEKYDSVIKTCALVKDFEQLPHGDKSIIGERGASLSGGQKARISLARAVYRRSDIYLLDDPLSAVDAHVGRHLFDECIGPRGILGRQKKTRILVTHQVHFLKEADWVIILKDGEVEMQGSPHDLSKGGIDIAELLQSEEELDKISEFDAESSYKRSRKGSKSSIRSKSSTSLNDFDEDISDNEDEKKEKSAQPDQNLEQSSKGKVKGSLFGNYLKAGAHPIFLFVILLLFCLTQFAASAADYWVSYWTSQEELRFYQANNINITDGLTEPLTLLSTEMCIYIHGGLVLTIFIVAIIRSVCFYSTAVNASQKMHDGSFAGIIRTNMRFFDTNPSGRILNRFSKDMGAVDEVLPKAILDASQIILNMVGAIVVTATVNPYFLIPIGVLSLIFMAVRTMYLKTSKNIKRLEGITRSPVFTHLSASLAGLPTIRAFNAQSVLIKEFDGHQDLHTAAWYMFITASTAFGFLLDIMCLIFVFIVTFSFLFVGDDILGDQVGLAITQAMFLTGMIQWGVRQSAEVANQLMSVERLLEYRDLTPEKEPNPPKIVPDTWPGTGLLKISKITYRYFEGAEPVLRDLEFEIQPKQKIGIVGRTGAGKSSLIGVLFRLAEIEGDIIIDDVNTGSISLEKLRSKISIIPQDPVLFSGTIRRNLDPFEEYPDADLWKSLEEVELKEIASGPLGLQTQVAAGGSNFSVGQRQLVCLARAILRSNKILVLDEATANVDPHTDQLIQETIRKRFADCTVLTVAHRLHTIMDSDRILVMDAGRAEEFGPPHELLQLPMGLLLNMVNATGPQEAEHLKKIARSKYLNESETE